MLHVTFSTETISEDIYEIDVSSLLKRKTTLLGTLFLITE